MMLAIGNFVFNTRLGQAAAAGLGIVAMFFVWLWRHDVRVAERARTDFAIQVTKETEKARDKAVKARKPAELPGAADRLLKLHCRDC